jgi:ribosomal protein L7/L12
MEALKCELCGSTSFTKIDDMFTCDYCKTKYSLNEAKKIIEALRQAELKVDGIAQIGNLLLRAQQFYDSEQYGKAEEYVEKVLDLDANNVDAQNLRKNLGIRLVGCRYNVMVIRVIREFTDWSLKETKEFVDSQTPYLSVGALLKDKTLEDIIKALKQQCGARLEGRTLYFEQ